MEFSQSRGTLLIAVLLPFLFLVPTLSAAQDSRAAQHQQQQAVKAAQVRPPRPNIFERTLEQARRIGWFEHDVSGVHPRITTVYPGGWLAVGAGYRRPFRDNAAFSLDTAWSMKNFKETTARVDVPLGAPDRFVVSGTVHWMDAPAVAFYGVGNTSRVEDRTTYGFQPTAIGLGATATPVRFVTFVAGADYMRINATLGDSSFLVSRASAQVDWRTTPGYSGSGGLYRVEVRNYGRRDNGLSGFRLIDTEVVQLVPIMRANWVIALRGAATLTDIPAGGTIPVYLMPSIGGNSSVRGYPSFRFLDNNRLLLSGEWRWTPAKAMDAAIFYDVGTVAARVSDLHLTDAKSGYGIGVRFHSIKRTFLRLELARNDEGSLRFVFSTNAAF